MIGLLRRLGRDLRTTLVGADPARPVTAPRPLFTALGILAIVGFGAMTNQYLKDTRHLGVAVAAGLSLITVVLPLVFLWYRPLWAWRVAVIGMLAGPFGRSQDEAWPWSPVQVLVMLLLLFIIGLREPVGVILWSGLATVTILWVEVNNDNAIGSTLLIVAILVFGEQIQRRRRAQVELKQQAERSEMLTERARIARELHDVVAHSLSLVAVRAETAPYRLGELPGPAREEFLGLAETARESLTELRRLLGVLRTDSGPDAARAPQPTLSDVDELVMTMRDAGMDISYAGTRSEPPAATGLTAFRIVQEALSNAARHAPGAPVRVTIAQAPGELKVEVQNGPPPDGRPAAAAGKGGHGLIGMRERVELLGGSLHYGRSEDDGFTVSAVMPLD